MRLIQYINEYKKVGRGKEISIDDALKLAPQYSQAIIATNSDNSLFVRYRKGNEPIYYIDPKKGQPRVSKDTSNFYTLIMDNSKRWSKYPKRSQSLIGISNFNRLYC